LGEVGKCGRDPTIGARINSEFVVTANGPQSGYRAASPNSTQQRPCDHQFDAPAEVWFDRPVGNADGTSAGGKVV
jgi:hypothetical protein